jgi:glycosyltransferase involved in cell wall biosynthesis
MSFTPAALDPRPDQTKSETKVSVTLAILAYKQEGYVAQALAGAFSQTYSPLTIIISDDASPDNTFSNIKTICDAYHGPHKVLLFRNERNLGIAEHVNKINALAQSELIVWGAADDVSMPHRVEKLVDCYLASNKTAQYLCSPVISMSADGDGTEGYNSPGIVARHSFMLAAICAFPISIGASQAWTKKLAMTFPPISAKSWAEDQVFGFRGVLSGPIGIVDEALVRYRTDSGITNKRAPFTLPGYLKKQLRGIAIYRQRASDSLVANRADLWAIIWIKIIVLHLSLPISPLLSMMRRSKYTAGIGRYL